MFENWEDANLKPSLLRGIYSLGFESPSPIQKQAILPMLSKQDVIAQAQSGTGKTGAFCIGLLQLCTEELHTQAIIIAPTRELAIQIQSVCQSLTIQMNIRTKLLIGGSSVDSDIRELTATPSHIIIGCPGRILDILTRKVIDNHKIHTIIIDEADEVLSVGFQEQLYSIFRCLSEEVQVVLFSATIPESLHVITDKFMRNPVKILVKNEMLTLEGISQFYVMFNNDLDKLDALKDLYESIAVSQSIIYCNSVKRVIDVYQHLRHANFPVCCIHSDMDRNERTQVYHEFKSGKFRVMISSNVTARGIDIQQVNIVVNFDIPKCVDTYLHRIGRSGRWGRKGVGINFVTRYDIDKMKAIEQHYKTEIKELPATFQNLL